MESKIAKMCAPQLVTRLGVAVAPSALLLTQLPPPLPQLPPPRQETTEETIARWRKAYNAKKREDRRKRMEKPELKELEQQRRRERFQNNKEKIADTKREKIETIQNI